MTNFVDSRPTAAIRGIEYICVVNVGTAVPWFGSEDFAITSKDLAGKIANVLLFGRGEEFSRLQSETFTPAVLDDIVHWHHRPDGTGELPRRRRMNFQVTKWLER